MTAEGLKSGNSFPDAAKVFVNFSNNSAIVEVLRYIVFPHERPVPMGRGNLLKTSLFTILAVNESLSRNVVVLRETCLTDDGR